MNFVLQYHALHHRGQFRERPIRRVVITNVFKLADDFCTNRADGIYVHPTCCTSFITCSNGITFVSDCPEGTAFDPELFTCVSEDAVDCSEPQEC